MKDYGHWDVSEVGEFNVRDYIGFVYVVEFDDGFMYIGSKKFWTSSNAIDELTEFSKETTWRTYKSSQKRTRNKIDYNPSRAKMKIVSLHKTYLETMVAERELHIKEDVVENPLYFNLTIANEFPINDPSSVSTKLWQDDDYRDRVSATKKLKRIEADPLLFSRYFAHVPTKSELELLQERYDKLRAKRNVRHMRWHHENKQVADPTETRRKRSEAAKARGSHGDEAYDKVSKALTGRKKTDEHIANAVAARKDKKKLLWVEIEGVKYTSISKAAKSINSSAFKVNKAIEDGTFAADFEVIRYPAKVIVGDVEYDSFKDAAIALNVSNSTITNRCKSEKFPEYQVIYK